MQAGAKIAFAVSLVALCFAFSSKAQEIGDPQDIGQQTQETGNQPQEIGKQEQLCAPGCRANFLGDGYCDESCNVEACEFDKRDCEHKAPVVTCAPGCPITWINDGLCDTVCNNTACSYDGKDCRERRDCAPGCPENYINDLVCDVECRVEACNFDGNDCLAKLPIDQAHQGSQEPGVSNERQQESSAVRAILENKIFSIILICQFAAQMMMR